mmetsp:Transcript_27419/g.45350  ORF Transcript_27419/g.45350 Transcript_27419/m.45350 type:complete len:126 (-) Transcript_27419:966-1343(-)
MLSSIVAGGPLIGSGKDNSSTRSRAILVMTRPTRSSLMRRIVAHALKAVTTCAAIASCFCAFYLALSSPPLHLFYDSAPHAGPASVYLPVRCRCDDLVVGGNQSPCSCSERAVILVHGHALLNFC